MEFTCSLRHLMRQHQATLTNTSMEWDFSASPGVHDVQPGHEMRRANRSAAEVLFASTTVVTATSPSLLPPSPEQLERGLGAACVTVHSLGTRSCCHPQPWCSLVLPSTALALAHVTVHSLGTHLCGCPQPWRSLAHSGSISCKKYSPKVSTRSHHVRQASLERDSIRYVRK